MYREEMRSGHDELQYHYFELSPTDPFFKEGAEPIARCYQYVYGTDKAWSEGKFCPKCSRPGAPRKWNLHDAPAVCPDCQEPTNNFWPIANIIADMGEEMARPHAVCVVACHLTVVVGGCWGFSATAEEMDHHLNHSVEPEARAPGVAAALRERFPNVARFAYQDEIFVQPEWQGKGVGRKMFAMRHRRFVETGLGAYVMRTKTNPPSSSYLWYASPKWGYEVVARYPDADERVILAQSFDRIPI
ncbi:MAG: GNAT family N-acetyltransferase [bacterium]|nr:GNAT family N-acetyltransferase [bacterium]